MHPIGQLTHTRRSDGFPVPDGDLKEEVRIKIRHYRNVYLNAHREESTLVNELTEESDQFRFLRTVCFANRWFDHGRPTPCLDDSLVLFLRFLTKRNMIRVYCSLSLASLLIIV